MMWDRTAGTPNRFSFSNTSNTLSNFSFSSTYPSNASFAVFLHSSLFLQNLNLDLLVTVFSQPSKATKVSSATASMSSQQSFNKRWNLSVLHTAPGCANFSSKSAYRVDSYRPTAGWDEPGPLRTKGSNGP